MSSKTKMIIDTLRETYQGADTELEFETPYQLLISTMMAAQSTDKQVNKVTRSLYLDYGNPESMAKLSQEELEKKIGSVGLYRNKAKNILATTKLLLEKQEGMVPKTLPELVALPGVGRKTANVVLSNAFGIPAFAVDTHVFRTSRRLGLAKGNTPEKVEQELMQVFERKDWKDAHHWLIFHGRRTCLARNPKCAICTLKDLCTSEDKQD
ncbi:endonuclease III [Clostridia bacterium]|nr:endonuclease III [Clostridia bacterium]